MIIVPMDNHGEMDTDSPEHSVSMAMETFSLEDGNTESFNDSLYDEIDLIYGKCVMEIIEINQNEQTGGKKTGSDLCCSREWRNPSRCFHLLEPLKFIVSSGVEKPHRKALTSL